MLEISEKIFNEEKHLFDDLKEPITIIKENGDKSLYMSMECYYKTTRNMTLTFNK